jgi:hypothetical protein
MPPFVAKRGYKPLAVTKWVVVSALRRPDAAAKDVACQAKG